MCTLRVRTPCPSDSEIPKGKAANDLHIHSKLGAYNYTQSHAIPRERDRNGEYDVAKAQSRYSAPPGFWGDRYCRGLELRTTGTGYQTFHELTW